MYLSLFLASQGQMLNTVHNGWPYNCCPVFAPALCIKSARFSTRTPTMDYYLMQASSTMGYLLPSVWLVWSANCAGVDTSVVCDCSIISCFHKVILGKTCLSLEVFTFILQGLLLGAEPQFVPITFPLPWRCCRSDSCPFRYCCIIKIVSLWLQTLVVKETDHDRCFIVHLHQLGPFTEYCLGIDKEPQCKLFCNSFWSST